MDLKGLTIVIKSHRLIIIFITVHSLVKIDLWLTSFHQCTSKAFVLHVCFGHWSIFSQDTGAWYTVHIDKFLKSGYKTCISVCLDCVVQKSTDIRRSTAMYILQFNRLWANLIEKKYVCIVLYLLNDSGSSAHTVENFNIIATNHNYTFQVLKNRQKYFRFMDSHQL